MSGQTIVDHATLDLIARQLTDLATAVDGCAADAPRSIDAGEATDAALDILSLLSEVAGRLVVGARTNAEQVTTDNASYRATERENTARTTGAGG